MGWHKEKAEACVRAWRRFYDRDPSLHAVVMICAVAALETRCGDSWKFSHNWGAIQIPRGLPFDPQFAEPHGDSSPINGPYVTNFWRFPDGWKIYPPAGLSGDEAGAWKLLKVLLEQRPAIKAKINTITSYELAELMYRSKYYEGTHNPKPKPDEVVDPGGLTEGQRLNVETYAGIHGGGISANAVAFNVALDGWDPRSTPDLSEADRAHALKGVAESLATEIAEGVEKSKPEGED